MKQYHCLIVDDEPIAHRILEGFLRAHARVGECLHALHTQEARQVLAENTVDLMLLDIQMPEESGISLLRTLEKRPLTIFTTAHTEFALEGYELGVLDYLVKPVSQARFTRALERALEFLDMTAAHQGSQQPNPETLHISHGAQTLQLALPTITHVQGLKDYAIIHTTERRYVLRQTMKAMETLLAPFGFVRVHKSFIVAGDKLGLIHRRRIVFGGYEIPVGRKYLGGGV